MMTREQIHAALKAAGAKLPRPARFMSRSELEGMYRERFGADPDGAPERMPVLRFADSGWCAALGRGYSRGLYRPRTRREYEALRPYAAGRGGK
ncbi:MAG: hypothetical protein LUE27_07170 [Clostridia bacterium]|nr:hypothetical protein [Clostridia bacterium]